MKVNSRLIHDGESSVLSQGGSDAADEGRDKLERRRYAWCFQKISARVDFTHLVEELDIEYRLSLIKLPHSKDVVMIISMLQYIAMDGKSQ